MRKNKIESKDHKDGRGRGKQANVGNVKYIGLSRMGLITLKALR